MNRWRIFISTLSTQKMASSFAWSSLENGGAQLAQVAVFFVAARILQPEDVGHASLALILNQAFQSIISTSINGYIVSLSDKSSKDAETCAFWLSVAFGILQLLVTAAVSAVYWRLTGKIHLPLLYLVAATTNLVVSLGIVQQAWMTRALAMRSLAIRTLSSVAIAGCCGIGMAVAGFGAYAIVLQTLLQAMIGTTLLWIFSNWRPGLAVSASGVRDVYRFTRHMVATGILNFSVSNADMAIVGTILGAHSAGVYAVARRALFAFNGIISTALSQVSLSVFARMRDGNSEDFESRFLKVISLTSIVTVPLFFALSGLSKAFILILFGPKWLEAATIMAVLMPFGALQSLGVYNQSFVIVSGRPDLQTKLAAIYAAVTIPLLALTAQFGLLALALSYTLRAYAMFPMSMALVTRRSGISHRQYFRAMSPAFLCGMLVGCTVWVAQIWASPSPFLQILAAVSAGTCIYFLFLMLFMRKTLAGLQRLVVKRM
ncbi:PST family polysaccharide transporter [Novosphingobium sp. 1529]|uniref:lipopolysaccharide biosynthesis protein n=1 Tax=Novosphingobium sp. 1529 TaxID=3156424 RepID=UPI0033908DC5